MLRAGQSQLVLTEVSHHFDGAVPGAALLAARAAEAACRAGSWWAAAAWVERGLALPQAGADRHATGLLQFFAGMAALHTGDYTRGEKALRRCVQAARTVPGLAPLLGDAYFHLGQLLGLQRRPGAAASYRRAAAAYRRAGRLAQAAAASCQAAWSHLAAGRPDWAAADLARAAAAAPGAGRELELDVAILQAWHAALTGDAAGARRLLAGLDGLSPRQEADAALVLAAAACASGDQAGSRTHAERASAIALAEWLHPQLDLAAQLRMPPRQSLI